MSKGYCKSCGAKIEWHRTAAGKAMPLDAVPNELGTIEVECEDGKTRRFMSHFASCPYADRHRKPKARKD
jgi:hypothetical protein